MTQEVGIAELREWSKREKLPFDDKTLCTFLHGCKNNQDHAKRKLRNYHVLKETTPEWFRNRDPRHPTLRRLLDLGVMVPLPVRDDQGRTVIIVRATANDPKSQPMTDVFKVGMMVIDLALFEDGTIARDGVFVVIDLDGVGLCHALQMTPALVRRAVHSWQDCYPIRLVGIEFVNCPAHVNLVLNLFRRFMRDKLRKRIRTHGKEHLALSEHIDPKCLPYEYGGTFGSLEPVIRIWSEKILSKRDWFLTNTSPLQQTILPSTL